MQRSRRPLIVIVIALLVGLLAAAVVVPRRTLTAKRDAADTAFAALRPSLDARYATVPSIDRKSTRLNSSHIPLSRMPSSA